MSGQFCRRAANSFRAPWIFVAVLTAVLCGCGIDLYEQRLQATKRWYDHLQLLDDNLARDWSNGVVSLRVPLQFTEIPGPQPVAADPNNPAAPPPGPPADPRKPDYAPLELTGLRAAFKADLRIDGGEPKPGFIYVISNHDFPNREQAKELHKQLVQEVSTAFHVPVEKWEEEQYPNKAVETVQPVHYQGTTITPPTDIGGFPRRVSLFLHTNGDVLTAILCVFPQKIDNVERINDRMPLCLETLNVSSDHIEVPGQAPPAEPAGTPAPAASGGTPAAKGF